ncbi:MULTISPECIES: general stress protein [Exiguobacterium]|uniref:general stress protein n=1 Tax=Exiguobacterium TaxID=33986 RepID=UPI001BECCDAD|nr:MULTISPECIES: general stress protein [Exiguobacterium]MCT4777435.1 general stress protein [Exiguobacterium aquaticum]MCT4789328.1 general stress protein [Exiguobacterium mexicanum]
MSEKRFISMYDTQDAALGKVEELRAKGYKDSDIYVVAKHEDNVSILRRQTDVHTEASHHTGWFDKVRAFLSGHEDVHAGLRNMGLSEEEVNRHYSDVEAGKILIYVDEDFERRHNEGLTVDSKPYNDTRHDTSHQGHHTADGLEIDSTPYNDPNRSTDGTGRSDRSPASDGLEIDSKPYNESVGDNPNRAVDPEQDRLDKESDINDRENKLRGLDDRALRNDYEDPDNIRRF